MPLWDPRRATDGNRRTPSVEAWTVQLSPVSSFSESPPFRHKFLQSITDRFFRMTAWVKLDTRHPYTFALEPTLFSGPGLYSLLKLCGLPVNCTPPSGGATRPLALFKRQKCYGWLCRALPLAFSPGGAVHWPPRQAACGIGAPEITMRPKQARMRLVGHMEIGDGKPKEDLATRCDRFCRKGCACPHALVGDEFSRRQRS